MTLAGKVAVVTGGASGIGRATSEALAAAGAHVFIGDLNAEAGAEVVTQIQSAGGKAGFVRVDVTDVASVQSFADTVHAQVGKADIVVNGAGWDKVEPFINNTPELWQKVVAINLMGPISVARAFLDPMIAAQSGKIINIASDAARVGSSGEAVYAGAKGGVVSFTKSLAREMARSNIKVNCVCPGPTDTPLLRASVSDKMRESFIRAIPLGRLATPEDIAAAVVFFAGPGTDYITGQVLSVSGGLTMHG
jgi:2-hydroxycyclohexanecarboxyl-CoA dehydrogenase